MCMRVHACVCVSCLSRVRLFVTPGTIAHQAHLSMYFSRQECWSGLPFPSLGNLPHSGIMPRSPASLADSLPTETPGKPVYVCVCVYTCVCVCV